MEYTTLRNNVITLAKVAHIAKIPTITTASVPNGPNGPIIPEIHQSNPNAVHREQDVDLTLFLPDRLEQAVEVVEIGRVTSYTGHVPAN